MAQQTINAEGAFHAEQRDKINDNFTELYDANDVTNHYEILTAADTLTAGDSGKTFYLNSATEFAVTLPAASLGGGVEYDIIVQAAPSSASYTVVTAGSENVMAGHIGSADLDATVDGGAATAADTITFVDGVAVQGDWVNIRGNGTSWYVRGSSDAVGGITITQESA